nr:MAG TPA: hypothetical protein [Caudoviricetes sp.]
MVLQGSMTRILFSILHSTPLAQDAFLLTQKLQTKNFQIYTISIDDHWSFR